MCVYICIYTRIIQVALGLNDRVSVVVIATRLGLGDPAFEPRWGGVFLHQSRPAPWSTQPPLQWVPGLFPGDILAGG